MSIFLPSPAQRLHAQFARVLPLVERVIAQAQSRVLDGVQIPSTQKVLSLFEPHTRVVKRHKLGAAVEFGRQVVFDEIDGGFVTRFHVLADGESERRQTLPAVRHHQAVFGNAFGHAPRLLTGDRGLHTKGVEADAQALGVRHVVIPRSGSTTAEQRAREHDPRWRRRYRWRAGIEGRIHSLRRDYGLARVRSHGEGGWNVTSGGAWWPVICAIWRKPRSSVSAPAASGSPDRTARHTRRARAHPARPRAGPDTLLARRKPRNHLAWRIPHR